MSPRGNGPGCAGISGVIPMGNFCLRRTTIMTLRARAKCTRGSGVRPLALAALENLRVELVTPEQLVELGAVALGEPRRLRDVALGDLQELRQVFALEAAARVLE